MRSRAAFTYTGVDPWTGPARVRFNGALAAVDDADSPKEPSVTTVMFVLHTKQSVDHAAASTYWRTTHAAIAGAIPGVLSYTQFHASTAPDGTAAPFLGVASLVFADDAAFGAAAQSPEFAAAIADLENFADSSQLPTAFVEQVSVVG